jgi:hypothetical protein
LAGLIEILAAGIIAVSVLILAWSNLKMSASTDALTAAVGDLETAANNATTEIASLKANGDGPAVDALTARVRAVAVSLASAITPAA